MKKLRIIDLGMIDYQASHELQLKLVEERLSNVIPDTIILLEHPHVITLGRRASSLELKIAGIPVYRVERGGEATYHGPGQLVGYVILNLSKLKLTVKELVWCLEELLIRTLRDFGIDGFRVEGHPGVWVGSRKKIASIGLALKSWITYHGFALNVNTDLSYFKCIRPCGLDPDVMTSMEEMLGRRIDMEIVKNSLTKHLVNVLNYEAHEYVRENLMLRDVESKSVDK
ncbi:MAG: lipoyl(octanoyl) transferase LipB [Nitrososphaerota archaeon]